MSEENFDLKFISSHSAVPAERYFMLAVWVNNKHISKIRSICDLCKDLVRQFPPARVDMLAELLAGESCLLMSGSTENAEQMELTCPTLPDHVFRRC